MRIVKRDEFLKLPAGTVYQKYKPCVNFFEEICVKERTISEYDFCHYIVPAVLDADSNDYAPIVDTSAKLDFNSTVRDGFFEEDQLFAVWEKEDVSGLVTLLQTCLIEAY